MRTTPSTSLRSSTLATLLLAIAMVPGCAPDSGLGEGEDVGEQEDALSAAEKCAVVKLANSSDLDTLDNDVKLSSKAAKNIVAARIGADEMLGTVDDEWFATYGELDAVSQVGPATLKKLKNYAAEHGVVCGDVSVQVLAFNDYHGAMEPPTGSGGRIVVSTDPAVPPVNAGGAEFLATHIDTVRATNPNTVVVAAGDVIGATPLLSAAFHDEPTIESVNLMGLDIAAVGNHEFDEGIEELWRMQVGGCHPDDGCQDGDPFEGADFAYLAANVDLNATGETIFPAYAVKQFGNARVGFIGVTLEGTPSVVTAAGTEGLTFRDEAETVNALVPFLQSRGVETIVLLIHEGGAATGLYNACEGISGPIFNIVSNLDPAIDVVVSGHTNAAHICNIDGRLVTSAAHNGRLLTDISLVVDELTGEVVAMQAENLIVTRTVTADAAQTALIGKYKALIAPIANALVGAISGDLVRLATPAGENAMGDVIADAQLEATLSLGAEIAFMNPGGVRADLVASQISGGEAVGQITYGELFSVQPFANNLVTLTVTGAEIDAMLEQQWLTNGTDRSTKPMILLPSAGFQYNWSLTRPSGDRVDAATITLNGVAINPAGNYRITVNSFLADGGDGFTVLKQGTNRVSGAIDLDALEDYFAAHVPVLVPTLNRISKF
jgi:5'-nucleotidase